MSQLSEINVNIETQKTLCNIQDVTMKIQRELIIINEMIRHKGNLSIAIEEANNTLTRIAQELDIKFLDKLLTPDDINEENLLNPVSVDAITQRLMSIMDS